MTPRSPDPAAPAAPKAIRFATPPKAEPVAVSAVPLPEVKVPLRKPGNAASSDVPPRDDARCLSPRRPPAPEASPPPAVAQSEVAALPPQSQPPAVEDVLLSTPQVVPQ